MTALRDLSIVKKLNLLLILTSCLAISISCVVFLSLSFFSRRASLVGELSALADITGNNCQAALAFNIREDAEQVLNSLSAKPSLVAACIYDGRGKVFAAYGDRATACQEGGQGKVREGTYFRKDYLEVSRRISLHDAPLGNIRLADDMRGLRSSLRHSILAMSAVLLLVLAAASLLGYYLLKRVLRPVLDLTGKARTIARDGNYAVRAEAAGSDEFGLLAAAFNQMLSKIEFQSAELEEDRLNLAARVAERTKELEAANRELDAFGYSVSHDLRAPLRSINGFAGVLRDDYSDKLDENGRRVLQRIAANAKKMDQLISDLLAFSHLGRQELNFAPVDMKELVAEVFGEIRGLFPEKRGIELVLADLCRVNADAALLRQVWSNLISNALKFTGEKKTAVIKIGCETEGNEFKFYIRDNGAGFDMRYSDKLFGVFQRLHSGQEFEGNGVGLALVQRIIQRHKGRVWAEGETGKGAVFYFTLPKGGGNG